MFIRYINTLWLLSFVAASACPRLVYSDKTLNPITTMNTPLSALDLPVVQFPSQRLPAIEARYKYVNEVLIPQKRFFKCQISLLIVTDASGSFDKTASFGLGHFLTVFNNDPANPATDNPASYVNFTVKTAHRGGGTSDFPNFKFDAHNLAQYDQIWLFGVARLSTVLSQKELKALATFMDEGGGVFATGDHEDLGVDLCGSVPRVRCMRRWYFNTVDPLGSPPAPPQTTSGGILNHNTITDNPATGANEKLGSSFQSDNYPQNIFPRYRRVFTGSILKRRVFPHPVLCGPNGVIKVLPDHMHEGKCDIYNDFGRTLIFDGASFVEFPKRSGSSVQEVPKVIADNINQIDNTQFESISVYDGHATDKTGRVVCDATWHHFFNINLVGFEASRGRVRAGIATAEDLRSDHDYVNIRAYFRNIAYWLARRNDQNCMRNKGYHLFIHDFDFQMTYKPLKFVSDRLTYYHFIGELAKDTLNQYAPQCQWTEWIDWVIKDLPIYRKYVDLDFDPEQVREKFPDLFKWVDAERIQTMALGKAMVNLFEFVEKQGNFSERSYESFDKVALEGREELVKEIFTELSRELDVLQRDLKL